MADLLPLNDVLPGREIARELTAELHVFAMCDSHVLQTEKGRG